MSLPSPPHEQRWRQHPAAAAAVAAAVAAADDVDVDPHFLWSASDIDEKTYTIDTSFTGVLHDYFVVVKRRGCLYGHCRLTKLQIKKGRKFTNESNSNLGAFMRSSFPKTTQRLKDKKYALVACKFSKMLMQHPAAPQQVQQLLLLLGLTLSLTWSFTSQRQT